ncbi:MAG: biotin/lipoyl-containing protein, partial [Burkholderiales bacterium]
MSIVEVKVPQLSESVAEATLLQWKKRPGEKVEMDEILVEIETDKVVLEVPAPASGVMAQLVKNDGELCVADEVIAKIDTEGKEAVSPLDVKAISPAVPAPGATPGVTPPATPDAASAGVAMPAAAKLMADNRIPVGSVPGTGKDGRVTKGDVLGAIEAGSKPVAMTAPVVAAAPKAALPSVAAPPAPSLGDRPEQRVPMSRLRARIAERLVQSQSTNAILTTFNEVNMAPVMEMRKRFQEKFEKEHGVKI